VLLDRGDNTDTIFLGGGHGGQRTSKIWCNLRQLLTLNANISRKVRDVDNPIGDTFRVEQKNGELWSTNSRDYVANVYPP